MSARTRQRARAVDGVVWMEDIREQRVDWAWRGYIPYGKLTVLDGDPSLGKSTIAYDLVARFSVGPRAGLPDGGGLIEPSVCLVVSGEDDLADTVKPRLRAGHADMTRVGTLALRHDDRGNVIPFTVPDDVERLRGLIESIGARFVVIDPIMGFLSERINSHNDASVRRALGPLTTLAQETGAALLALRHLNKDTSTSKAMYRGGGSIAITAAARSVLLAAQKPGQPNRRILAQTKGNLIRANGTPSLEYSVEPWDQDRDIPRISWHGTTRLTADDLLKQHDGRRDNHAERAACEFWEQQLADGAKRARVVTKEAKLRGISESTLKRAAGKLGLHKYRDRDKLGRTTAWFAHLPDQPEKACDRCR